MKKLYTLLAAACITGSAFALTPGKEIQKVNLPEGMTMAQILQKAEATQVSSNKTSFRIKNKADDTEWACLIALTEWSGMEIEQFPYYQMIFTCQPIEDEDRRDDFYQLVINWPTWGSQDMDFATQVEGGLLWDREKVEEKYGDKAFKPYTFEEFQEYCEGNTMMITLPGLYYAPCVLGPEAFGEYAPSWTAWEVNGNTYYPKSATRTSQGWDYADACTFNWTSFDSVTSDVTIDFVGKYTNTYEANGPLAGSTLAELDGTGVVLGFADILWDTVGEVHIFNGGRQGEYDDWTMNYDEQASEPLNYYYLCFADDTMGYQAQDKDGNVMQNYTEKTLPENRQSDGRILYGAPSYSFGDGHFTYLAGAIWAKENSEYPYGTWSMKTPEIVNNGYVQIPEAGNLVVAGLPNSYVNYDGFHGAYEGYGQNGIPGEVFVGIGDKNLGLNYKFGSNLTNGHHIMGSYTGDIIYHPTPDMWVSDVKFIPSVADEDADVINTDPSAVEAIESDAPVVSKAYYNFQGQRLSSEPENGMYIIRAVKADGSVKAIKVAK